MSGPKCPVTGLEKLGFSHLTTCTADTRAYSFNIYTHPAVRDIVLAMTMIETGHFRGGGVFTH